MSKIEWTEKTWNPIVGYANEIGKMSFDEKALLEPLKGEKPTMYFVCSMGDLFHPNVADEWIDQVFAVMAMCPQHTFQVLTKRPDRMELYLVRAKDEVVQDIENAALSLYNDLDPSKTGNMKFTSMMPTYSDIEVEYTDSFPLPNVWLGTSIEDQKKAEERIPHLQRTPAAVRFLSCEPLLEMLCLRPNPFVNNPSPDFLERIDWVIVGGESGAGARPMQKEWVEEVRLDCHVQAVPFFFKQWGDYNEHGERVGKKAAGRLLNDKEYNGMPKK